MATNVASATNVVNQLTSTSVVAVSTVELVRTLSERVAWVLENRGITMASWGLKAGLSRGVVSQALKRESEGNGGGFGSVNNAKLAQAASVDATWLSTGEGQPELGTTPKRELVAGTIDTQQLVNEAARMLVELDGLELPAALMLVHDVRLTQPTVDGYYRAARLRMSRGPITEEVERAAERELQLAAVGANKKRG